MVSVIIPNSNQTKYLYRCINSLKRQSYSDLQIIVITNQDIERTDLKGVEIINVLEEGPYSGLNQALRLAKGDFVLFCNMSSVLSADSVKLMFEESNDYEWISCANYYEKKDSLYIQSNYEYTSIFGKLFSYTIIEDNKIAFSEESELCLIKFLAQYYSVIKGNRLVGCDIYDSICDKIDASLFEQSAEGENWKEFLYAISNQEKEIGDSFCDELCDKIKDEIYLSDNAVNAAGELLHDKFAFQKKFVLPTVKRWWVEINDTDDNDEINTKFITYLKKYSESDEFLDLLLNEFGIEKEQMKYLEKYDCHDALFFIKNTSKAKNDVEKNINLEIILNKLEAINASNQAMKAALKICGVEMDAEQQGVLNGIHNGLVKIENNWFYFQNGEINFHYNGLAKNKYGWYYVKDGVLDNSYNGIVSNRYGVWCVEKGTINKLANGYKNVGGTEAFFVNGKVDQNIEGLLFSNEQWKYYKKGLVDKSFRGLIEENNQLYYIENGTINKVFEGLVEYNGKWFFVKGGSVDFQFEGFAVNNSGWHYVKDGILLDKRPDNEKSKEEINLNEQVLAAIKKENEEMRREELEVIAIQKFQKGQLGFRTILKSFGAWLKYKL